MGNIMSHSELETILLQIQMETPEAEWSSQLEKLFNERAVPVEILSKAILNCQLQKRPMLPQLLAVVARNFSDTDLEGIVRSLTKFFSFGIEMLSQLGEAGILAKVPQTIFWLLDRQRLRPFTPSFLPTPPISIPMIKELLKWQEGRQMVDAQNLQGDTPFILAAREVPVQPELLDLLLDAGSDLDAQNKRGETALSLVKTPELARWLILEGASIGHLKEENFLPTLTCLAFLHLEGVEPEPSSWLKMFKEARARKADPGPWPGVWEEVARRPKRVLPKTGGIYPNLKVMEESVDVRFSIYFSLSLTDKLIYLLRRAEEPES